MNVGKACRQWHNSGRSIVWLLAWPHQRILRLLRDLFVEYDRLRKEYDDLRKERAGDKRTISELEKNPCVSGCGTTLVFLRIFSAFNSINLLVGWVSRLAFSVFPLMYNSSVIVVPQPDTQRRISLNGRGNSQNGMRRSAKRMSGSQTSITSWLGARKTRPIPRNLRRPMAPQRASELTRGVPKASANQAVSHDILAGADPWCRSSRLSG